MKRHQALIPLTHDHHHALAQVRQLRTSAAALPEQRLRKANEFIAFFEADTLAHFREEEEVVFPLVVGEREAEAPLTRLMMDHLRIHSLVRVLTDELRSGSPTTETMTGIAEILEAHIRFEEKTFFPLVERLAATGLTNVDLARRDRSPSANPDEAQVEVDLTSP